MAKHLKSVEPHSWGSVIFSIFFSLFRDIVCCNKVTHSLYKSPVLDCLLIGLLPRCLTPSYDAPSSSYTTQVKRR